MVPERLIGTWKFESLVARTATGKVRYPYGEKPFGILIYTPSGHMSMLLMNPDRKRFTTDDPKAGTPEETIEAYDKFDAYCGTYAVDKERGIVTHHLEGAKFPNWVGTDQVRYFQIEDDRLHIKATVQVKGEDWFYEGQLLRARSLT